MAKGLKNKNMSVLPKRKKGAFIVIDGIDGSGKKTQVDLLIKKIRKNGLKVKTIDFPQYENNFFGKFIGECLVGQYGDFAKLDSRIASVLYAADRFESSSKIKKWLREGNIVIADRYVSSNQIHQGGKLLKEKERQNFLRWLEKMEFEVFKIPKPDAIVYLNVPLELSLQLLKNKDNQKKKKYLQGKKDAHENNVRHLSDAMKSALSLVKERNNWLEIKCSRNGKMLDREEIAEMVWKKIKYLLLD